MGRYQSESRYSLHVQLAGIEPPIWRTMVVPVQELWVQPIFLGQGKLAHTSFLQVDKSALEQAGARVIGVFDLIVGEKIPTFMIFLGWRDGASRMAGIRRYQIDPTVLACRAEEHTKVGSDVFCISDRYLFEAASLLPSGQDTSTQSLLWRVAELGMQRCCSNAYWENS